AHKAEEEGIAVAERIAGQHGHVDFNTVPWVIYTSPEIAWVGQTEKQLKDAGTPYRAGTFPFMANGRARALGDTSGFVKILADANVGAPTSGALSAYLAPVLERRDIVLDASQIAALGRLERLHDEFAGFVRARRSLLRRWFNPPIPPRGVYLWGGVGRGKSFLMDAFSAAVPLRRKTRVHFHAFMKGVHEELRTLKHEEDPLAKVAARIARRYRL